MREGAARGKLRWSPGEARDLLFDADGVTIRWSEPLDAGGDPLLLSYDTLRADDATRFFVDAVCVESAGTDRLTIDPDDPVAGAVFHYLVRAASSCPGGTGPLGTWSDGTPHTAAACP